MCKCAKWINRIRELEQERHHWKAEYARAVKHDRGAIETLEAGAIMMMKERDALRTELSALKARRKDTHKILTDALENVESQEEWKDFLMAEEIATDAIRTALARLEPETPDDKEDFDWDGLDGATPKCATAIGSHIDDVDRAHVLFARALLSLHERQEVIREVLTSLLMRLDVAGTHKELTQQSKDLLRTLERCGYFDNIKEDPNGDDR